MKKEDKKVEKEKKFKISEIFTNKRYYAIANLVFYSVVILVLIASVRSNPTPKVNGSDNNNAQGSYVEGFQHIKSKNFKFTYVVKSKEQEIIYDGKQSDDKILFVNQSDKKEYFKQKGIVLEKKENDYVLNTTFKSYFDFFDVDLINDILQSARFEDGEYFISNKDFSEKVGFPQTEDTVYGAYIQTIKQNDIITSIVFDFSEIDTNIETITLQYKNYGLVEDFDIK